jgi:hypothetical protein
MRAERNMIIFLIREKKYDNEAKHYTKQHTNGLEFIQRYSNVLSQREYQRQLYQNLQNHWLIIHKRHPTNLRSRTVVCMEYELTRRKCHQHS